MSKNKKERAADKIKKFLLHPLTEEASATSNKFLIRPERRRKRGCVGGVTRKSAREHKTVLITTLPAVINIARDRG